MRPHLKHTSYVRFFNVVLLLAALTIQIALGQIASAAPTCTTTCFVATTGNDTNAGDSANPLATIQAAVNQVNDGGDVIVDVGVYIENVVINKSVTITGQGDGTNPATDTIVDGGAAGSVFVIQQEHTVEITDLTITNGSADEFGGGVVSTGSTVTLSNCEILENASGDFSGGGGVANLTVPGDFPDPPIFGNMTVNNCNIHDNEALGLGGQGGGIYDGEASTVTVNNSTIADNQANGGGGGIYGAFSSHIVVNRSTIAGNDAGADGSGNGGAIGGVDLSIQVTNSTLSGNFAPSSGGGIRNTGTLTIINSTVAYNEIDSDFGAGGIDAGLSVSTMNIANTIIAYSIGGPDCLQGSATINATGVNLIEDNTCSPDLSGDPMLISLASNGGPTQTHALQIGSPALDAGDDGICSAAPVNGVDQRGIIRPQGVACDIGAYEAEDVEPGSITITKNANPSASAPDFGFDTSYGPDFFLYHGESNDSGDLMPGTYTVSENGIAVGWRLADIDCGDADVELLYSGSNLSGVQIELGDGEDVECTFFNEQRGNIIIDKVATGGGATAFHFTFDNGVDPIFNFDLTDGGGDGLFDNLQAGEYTVEEVNIPAGWSLDDLSCNGGNVTITKPSVQINLGIGETITCTFTNVENPPPTGGLDVTKIVSGPAPGGEVFSICITGPSYGAPNCQDFTDGATLGWSNLIPGIYTVDEVDPGVGWTVAGEGNVVVNAGPAASVNITNTFTPPVCNVGPGPQSDLTGYIVVGGGTATGYVTNNSGVACTYPIGLAAYSKFNEVIDDQVLFSSSVDGAALINPGETVNLTVPLPDCAAQVDLFYGDLLPSLNGFRYGSRLLAVVQVGGSDYCVPEASPVVPIAPEVSPEISPEVTTIPDTGGE